MSALSLWDVQSGVYSRLTGHAALTALLPAGANGIFDHVPQQTAFPYVAIGETASRPLDTQGGHGHDTSLSIHVYTRSAGMRDLRRIMAAAYDALHDADFTVPDQVLALCRCQSIESAIEGDGITRHGILRFRIITEPAED